MEKIEFKDFLRVKMCVGTIKAVAEFPKAKKPAYQLTIDFGEAIGLKKSSAQITALYNMENLIDRQIIAVVNFPVRQIANFFSEVLVLGLENEKGEIVLIQPEQPVPNGTFLS
jgi:tRNA-binding protein